MIKVVLDRITYLLINNGNIRKVASFLIGAAIFGSYWMSMNCNFKILYKFIHDSYYVLESIALMILSCNSELISTTDRLPFIGTMPYRFCIL
jgi:hypothetical protein